MLSYLFLSCWNFYLQISNISNTPDIQVADFAKYALLEVLELFHRVGKIHESMQVMEGFILNCDDAVYSAVCLSVIVRKGRHSTPQRFILSNPVQ